MTLSIDRSRTEIAGPPDMTRAILMTAVLAICTACARTGPERPIARVDSAPFPPSGPPTFEAFVTSDTLSGTPATPDFTGDSIPPRLRELIDDAAKGGPNFAGVFSIVTWGCGSQCQSHIVLDRRTGRMISDTLLDFSCHEPEFRLNSTLVIMAPDTATFGPCSDGPTRYFRWSGDHFESVPG